MPNKDEKIHRKELLRSLRNEGRQRTLDDFPASVPALKELFDFLDTQLADKGCDHTLRFAREYVRRNAMGEKLVILWLEKHGGYCDCEVLNNVEAVVADVVPGYDKIHDENGSVN